MSFKLRALSEHTGHPHEGKSFHMKGKDLPTQYHGGPVEVHDVEPARLQLRDKGTHGRGFYTTSSADLAKGYRRTKSGVVTVKHASPDAKILVAGEHEHTSHPDLVSAVKEFSPKYAKVGDVGMGEMTWRGQVNKFAEHHRYDAIRFTGKQDGKDVDHVVWKNHLKLKHGGLHEGAEQHPHAGKPWYKKGSELSTQHHGGPEPVTVVDPKRSAWGGFYTSSSRKSARTYFRGSKGIISSFTVRPDAHILSIHADRSIDVREQNHPDLIHDIEAHAGKPINTHQDLHKALADQSYAKKNGYDATHVDLGWEDETRWHNAKVLTPAKKHGGLHEGVKGEKIMKVPVADLHYTQPAIGNFRADFYAKYPSTKMPIVYTDNGKLYVDDGHHRVEGARRRGDTHIKVRHKGDAQGLLEYAHKADKCPACGGKPDLKEDQALHEVIIKGDYQRKECMNDDPKCIGDIHITRTAHKGTTPKGMDTAMAHGEAMYCPATKNLHVENVQAAGAHTGDKTSKRFSPHVTAVMHGLIRAGRKLGAQSMTGEAHHEATEKFMVNMGGKMTGENPTNGKPRYHVEFKKLKESAEMTCVGCNHPPETHKLGVCSACKSIGTKYHDFMKAQYYHDKPLKDIEHLKTVLGRRGPKRAPRRKVHEDIITCKSCGRGVHDDDGKCIHCGAPVPQKVRESRVHLVPLNEVRKVEKDLDPGLANKIPKHEISGSELGSFLHGSGHKIHEFDPRRLQTRDSGFFGTGMYATKDKNLARNYAKYSAARSKTSPHIVRRELQPNAKVLRYHREVSKNQPEFVEKVKQHALTRGVRKFDNVEGHMRKIEPFEVEHAAKHDQKEYMPQDWDHMVRSYADHHNYDAVHVIHHTYGKERQEDYPEREEIRVRNLHALAGPEAQRKLPGTEHLMNYNKPPKKTILAKTQRGGAFIVKKYKRKEHISSYDIGSLGASS